jgi:exopolyphosphatase/guanosine-5'-triphosphate,3'-diphosphate pyrophosphatase
MHKIAAIDIGSNAIRMIVGSVNGTSKIETVENIRLPIRLGGDAFTAGYLREQTIQQATDAFVHFRRVADDFEVSKVRAVATSALREASNSDMLIDRIARASKIEIDLISGDEEARLIHLAVASAVNLKNKRAVLIDIGGGSVEVTISENQTIVSTESYKMGTVRLLQKLDNTGKESRFSFYTSKQPFSLLVREYAEAARQRIDREFGDTRINLCIGTGGNVEELGKLRQKLFDRTSDRQITPGELQDLIEKLSGMSIKDRIRKFKLRPDRADVILPAAIVLQIIAREAKAREIAIPQVGLKDGLLLEIADELARGPHLPRREQVWESALRLGLKYQFDAEHARLTAKLAGQLFDQSKPLHNLGDEERLLLEIGALLQDIGHFINMLDHDKHGYYILKADHLVGLNDRQHEIVANLVRYHRKSIPSPEDPNFRSLPQKDRLTVTKLTPLLRLAGGMDVSRARRITHVTLSEKKRNWELFLHSKGDLTLETWALNKRRGIFEEVFGVQLEVVNKE